jgi:SAM-dependent methyltransferase
MTPELLPYLCEPVTGNELVLEEPVYDESGYILSGRLVTEAGSSYPVVRGIPRFVQSRELAGTVKSFGDEWNYFNFTDFKFNWLVHTVKNTFGSVEVFKDKIIVDAGGGSGAQTLWMLEAGAKHVIMLELSDSVDDVVARNLSRGSFLNYDVIQCSIDAPPLKRRYIDGIVYCHNVIQHTPSVEKTAHALYELVAPGGEFVFNCYPLNDKGCIRWIRYHLIYRSLRAILSRMPFELILFYARTMGVLRQIPVLGLLLEKSGFCVQGDVPKIDGDTAFTHLIRRIKATTLNTFDGFGSHNFQHLKRDDEIRTLISELQKDPSKTLNADKYFSKPPPIGCALRIFR